MKLEFLAILAVVVLSGCSNSKLETGPPNSPPQGTTSSGGGGAYVLEFKDIGRTVVRRLRGKQLSEIEGVSTSSFAESLERLRIHTTEEALTKDGKPVDAINYPSEMRIDLSLKKWAYTMDFSQKQRVVIHELLGILNQPDPDGIKTTSILKALDFLSEVSILSFEVDNEVAKTLVEKMRWEPGEVSVVDYPEIGSRFSSYRLRGVPYQRVETENRVQDIVVCFKSEGYDPRTLELKAGPRYWCRITGFSVLNDQRSIHMPCLEQEKNQLWLRLLGERSEESFDYGVIRGGIDSQHVAFIDFFL